jgi:signal transduction histidine kinase
MQWRFVFEGRLRWLPYVALACVTLLAVVAPVPHRPWAVTLPVVLITAAWLYVFSTSRPEWENRTRVMGTFFTGLIVLDAVLVWCNPLYAFFTWTGYLYVLFALRGRWRLLGAASVGTITAISQVGGFTVLGDRESWAPLVLVWLINVSIGTALTFMAVRTNAEAVRREQLLSEVAEANGKLSEAMAENAGLHAQLLVQAREAGVLDERQRMAGEIHDVLAQGLTGIVTQLEAAGQAANRPADWQRHLDTAKQLARDSLTEARRSVQALRPQPLVAAALPDALAEVVDGWSARNRVTAELITTGTAQPLLPEIEATLLRTAQEALANVEKHARASRVALTLSYLEDLVTLDVRDDGTGFDPSTSPARRIEGGGFGLAAMRERVLRIAGTLEVESEPGNGTAISACVPAITVPAAA